MPLSKIHFVRNMSGIKWDIFKVHDFKTYYGFSTPWFIMYFGVYYKHEGYDVVI